MVDPVVSGPVTGGRGPFGAPADDLAGRGHLLEEYIVEGVAGSWRPVPGSTPGRDGRWHVEPGEEAGYRTRFVVVRPADPTAFSGVLVVNWQNVTSGFDLGVPPAEVYRAGHAWVGVTAQRVGVHGQPDLGAGFGGTSGLVGSDPDRYGSLHHPGDAWSYDVFTQVARLVAAGGDVLGGLAPHTVLATGSSQSAMRLGSYLNLAHAPARVFDGFLLLVHWGLCPYPPDQSLMESFAPTGDGLRAGTSRIHDATGTPVLVLCSETETLGNHPVRQPDTDSFRFWEIAGAAHGGGDSEAVEVLAMLGLGSTAPPGLVPNQVQWSYLGDAALRHLVAWAHRHEPPPSFPPIDVDPDTGSIVRDEDGNAVGGIRPPELVVPTGTHRGDNSDPGAAGLLGETVPLPPERLRERCPDAAAFVAAWDGAVDALSAAGLDLTPALPALRERGRRIADDLIGTGT